MFQLKYPWRLLLSAALLGNAWQVTTHPARAAGSISLGAQVEYQENFDSLANSGTSSSLPPGWEIAESGSGANASYTASAGSGTSGDTYSYGASGSGERALGSVQTSSVISNFGAAFSNNTGGVVESLQIQYSGEQWRVGNVGSGRVPDRLDFQISTDATSLTSGSWQDVNELDFSSPVISGSSGAMNGNANPIQVTHTIHGLSIPNGSTFWIRWQDFNIASSDDGLAIDNFLLTPVNAPPQLSINDASVDEGDTGLTNAHFTISLSAPATKDVEIHISTTDGTALAANTDYTPLPDTLLVIPTGEQTLGVDVTIHGDTDLEPNETFQLLITQAEGATILDGSGQGTIQNDDGPAGFLSISDVSLLEGPNGSQQAIFTISIAPALSKDVFFDLATQDGSAKAGTDYELKSVSQAKIAAGETSYSLAVTVYGDLAVEADENFQVEISNPVGASIQKAQGEGLILNDDVTPTPICAIQGNGASAALTGAQTVQGIVIGDFESGLDGFYLQQPNCDEDPATSDGIFIYHPNQNSVSVGDWVQVAGTAMEYQGQTQITQVTQIIVLDHGNSLPPTDIQLPAASATTLEAYEGMLVRFHQSLSVTSTALLGRLGELTLSSGGRLWQPTSLAMPGTAAQAQQALNDLNQIVLDDSSFVFSPEPIVFGRGGQALSATNTLRAGDTITDLTGVLTYRWGGSAESPNTYRVQTIGALVSGQPGFETGNTRPASPPAVPGRLRIASLNLLNYFNSFGCSNCRGADSAAEFERQSAKLTAAIQGLDADIIAILELENDGYGPESAIQTLVNRLNANATEADTYTFINADAATGKTKALGADAIKVGLLYKPAAVQPAGLTAVLDSEAFVFGGDTGPRNRVSLLQAFVEKTSSETFLVNVNHLKSRAGCPTSGPNQDAGDGQGCWNPVRLAAAQALGNWLASDPTGTHDPDLLIVGDFNAYDKENPLTALAQAGYQNLVAGGYSYGFGAQWGALDHALASASLASQPIQAAEWHINADEPAALDYNLEQKSAAQQSGLYSGDGYRSSDHDPLLVGISLNITPPETTITSKPPANAPSSNASFSFESSKTVAQFECALDAAPFSTCTSPQTYPALANGTHQFQVRARDAQGNTDASPAAFSWLVDTLPPDTTLTTGLTSLTRSSNASFGFSASESTVSFQCSLDGATYSQCASPQTYAGLAAGAHSFNVRATDLAGNIDGTPATFGWTIDNIAPQTTITSQPSRQSTQTSAEFRFTGNETGVRFECKRDSSAYAPCTSPVKYSNLAYGVHRFSVRAIDRAGNIDTTPAAYQWSIRKELVQNGGFNLYPNPSVSIPSGWLAHKLSSVDGKSLSNRKEGLASIHFSGVGGVSKSLEQTIQTGGARGDASILSFWVKGAYIPIIGTCFIKVEYFNQTTLAGTKQKPCPAGIYDYTYQETTLLAPADYTTLRISLVYDKPSGNIWFDLLSLVK